MSTSKQKRIKELIDRLGRISAADEWGEDINPTQLAALSYLAQANKFSRSPSQVSDFMAATRGTVSQTLKALARKGLIEETRLEHDKRSISYSVTDSGKTLFLKSSLLEQAASKLDEDEASQLLNGLEGVVRAVLKERGLRAFGVCNTCHYHRKELTGGFCNLLEAQLCADETKQICHEHKQVA